MAGPIRLDHTVTSGTFTLDGETFNVDNNAWVIGDDDDCYVFDAPHDTQAVANLVGDRRVLGVLLTHAHDDHVACAPALADQFHAPLCLHPDDQPLWNLTHPNRPWDRDVRDGDEFPLGDDAVITVIHTPGHSPGSVCYYVPALSTIFSGDTLFQGGPGATGRSFSSRPTIERSIQERLFVLPSHTVVHTGHGEDTTIGEEKTAFVGERPD
ncbi:MBL fold metallo-hydrolase [Devriesea agamarum]|uniref:MBL fold metallo-hydrolase n=1 Tax=Devriesea agamarum TaxID=472569 RepID=UPI00071D6C53|nr:MBL fold metallo-hydrolase [Devriesea agamarum]